MKKIETGNQNPILRTVTKPVTIFDKKLKKKIEGMKKIMLKEDPKTGVYGVGLAANQIGIDAQIFLFTTNIGTKKEKKIIPVINPEILDFSPTKISLEEGCLSVPDVYADISRPNKIKVRWQNPDGRWCERRFDKWDARIFLHEFDHLRGILFTDYLKK
jgi:peptide deformylase